ncbi:MAG: hypothetical protein JWN54_752 [Mycobacterium sp.]|nr:hypothetical protein [Mycobacterium sp.]
MSDDQPIGVLRCGAAVDDLLDQVADGNATRRTGHQADCAHCRAALAELDDLWSPVRAYAAEEITAPADLLSRMMVQIRQLTEVPGHATFSGERGVTRIAARVAEVIARAAADRVPGVVAALGKVSLDSRAPGPGADATVAVTVVGRRAVVDVTVAAAHGEELHVLAGRIRRAVAADLYALTTMEAIEVNVRIDDLA